MDSTAVSAMDSGALAIAVAAPTADSIYLPIASATVLAALDEPTGAAKREELLNELMNALRQDMHPGSRRRKETATIRFMAAPQRATTVPESPTDK